MPLGETCVTKSCPATPVIQGTLHLGVGGGQSVGILCRRSIRHTLHVRLRLWAWLWSLADGGLICSSSDVVWRALFFLKGARALICLPGIKPGNMVTRHTVAPAFRSGPHFFLACWAVLPLVGQPPQARSSASRAPLQDTVGIR